MSLGGKRVTLKEAVVEANKGTLKQRVARQRKRLRNKYPVLQRKRKAT